MAELLTEEDIRVLLSLYAQTNGRAWEPKGGTFLPFFERAIAAGYVKRVDGHSGFEAFKDVMIAFTDAGRRALTKDPAP